MAGGKDLVLACELIADRLAEPVPFVLEHGGCLVLEALHPLYAADRVVLPSFGQALDLAAPYPVEAVRVASDFASIGRWVVGLQRCGGVEIFNERIWVGPHTEVMEVVKARFAPLAEPFLTPARA